ncbi:phosphoribosyltransferase family protein [Deinococcus aquaedulcis]|uniref:phosphoribosyltransferase family protein n=1 Tax=Deinococcus aquaedulcis TaxID=2840455 RepID=UPI001C831ABF|nr:phosphoribosyltransferase family protein [Deinococcus aquaedulcis]
MSKLSPTQELIALSGEWLFLIFGIIAGISTLLLLMEISGFMPKRMSNFFAERRTRQTIDTLNSLGFDTDSIKRANYYGKSGFIPNSLDEKIIQGDLDSHKVEGEFWIGENDQQKFPYYIDLMGSLAIEGRALRYAQIMVQFIRRQTENRMLRNFEYDFVACSKMSSPLLAYEISKILNKPLLLYSPEKKFKSPNDALKADFDTGVESISGKRVIIVDDSTTGGRKVMDVVKAIRKHNGEISDCFVIFEPIGKNASDKLLTEEVTLHSIVKTHLEGGKK